MKSWSAELITKIDSKLEGINEKDLRFFRIDEFKRNTTRVDAYSDTCIHCKKEKLNIQETVETIDIAIHKVSKNRKKYDKLISRLSKHMQKEHGFYTPYYFTYLISFFGIVAGSVLGYFLMQINAENQLELFCIGFSVGLLPTYIIGHLKDKKIRSQKKLM